MSPGTNIIFAEADSPVYKRLIFKNHCRFLSAAIGQRPLELLELRLKAKDLGINGPARLLTNAKAIY